MKAFTQGVTVSPILAVIFAFALGIPALSHCSEEAAEPLAFRQRINALNKQFREAYTERVATPFRDDLTKLNANYITALRRASENSATRLTDADQAAITSEIAHVEKNQIIPDELSPSSTVNTLRVTYRKTRAKFEKKHDQGLNSVLDIYDRGLAQLRPLVANRSEAYSLNSSQKISRQIRAGERAPIPSQAVRVPNAPPPKPEFISVVLEDFPEVVQDRNYCGPACATMIAQYFGRWVDQSVVARLASEDSERNRGTHDEDLISAMKCLGFDVKAFNLNALDSGRSKTQSKRAIQDEGFDLIRREIDAGRPLIFNYETAADGHYELIIGYEIHGDRHAVIRRDPMRPSKKIVTPIEVLADLWPRTDVGPGVSVSGLQVIKTPPRRPIGNHEVPAITQLSGDQLAPFQPFLDGLLAQPCEELTTFRLDGIASTVVGAFLLRCDIVREDKTDASGRARRFAEETGVPILIAEVAAGRPAIVIATASARTEELRWVVGYDLSARNLTFRSARSPAEDLVAPFDDFARDWVRTTEDGSKVAEIIYAALPIPRLNEEKDETAN